MPDPITDDYRQQMNALAEVLDEFLNGKRKPGKKPKIGFVLLISEFGKMEGGRVNYISNGKRPDMIAMLREYLARVEGRAHDEPQRTQ